MHFYEMIEIQAIPLNAVLLQNFLQSADITLWIICGCAGTSDIY